MTAGNNGPGTPENDDPFAYLYRSDGGEGGADGAAGAGRTAQYGRSGTQPGVPRTSYNQVRRVGERRYGDAQRPGQAPGAAQADAPTAAYGAAQPGYGSAPAGQGAGRSTGYGPDASSYGGPNPSYAAPETLPGGAPRRAAHSTGGSGRGGHGGGRGPNNQALLIGALAVVGVVVLGIVIAMATNSGGEEDDPGSGASVSQPADQGGDQQDGGADQDEDGGKDDAKPFTSERFDAVGLRTAGGATVAKEVPGARSESGAYVAGMNQPGATATWRVDVPEAGKYTLYIGYGVPGKDTEATLLVNGKDREQKLKNWSGAKEGEWDKGWTTTYAYIDLSKGTNTVDLTCGEGQGCEFNLDWVQLKEGHVKQ
ncbi:CBM35 domain-containing protein [Streptomyces zingiberis]|uniref:Carbohydrate-binding protein n=1 Tax=Streptomyces zingiberis TaxID=2053010 RepID=A0ABX1BX03_9ACTN|nr:CBM35 domain-containing protein [Streptomyces zingiberis]NJP99996.1 carbohydrate-binding protein [Streptomyces zingiberis]